MALDQSVRRFPGIMRGVPFGRDRVPALHAGPVRLVDHFMSGRSGMGVKLALLEIDKAMPHPFRGVAAGAANGQRLRVLISTDALAGFAPAPVYNGEAMLSWFSEDTTGLNIRLLLDDGPDGVERNPFQGYPVGNKAGASFAFACWAIDDHERIAEANRRTMAKWKPSKPFSSLSPIQQAQIKCRTDPVFQSWCDDLGYRLDDCPPPPASGDPADRARDVVRAFCRVSSRSQLVEEGPRALWEQMLESYNVHISR